MLPTETIVEDPVIIEPADMDSPEIDERALDALVDIAPIDEEALWHYIWLYYGFKIPRKSVCAGHCAPFDAMADMYFVRNPEVDTLWAGGRGSGKTLDLAIVEHMLMTHFGDTIGNVAALDEQAQACYRYIQSFDSKTRFAHRVKRSILSRTEYRNGANLKIMPGTVRAVNSSHPRLTCLDEVDQMDAVVLQEAASMPISIKGLDGKDRPPQSIFTSSLKYAYGNMVRMMDQAAEGSRALKTRTWCVFEIMKTCEPERHQQGVGCRGILKGGTPAEQPPPRGMTEKQAEAIYDVLPCWLASECLDSGVDGNGKTVYEPGPGKAARADGFMPVDDVIKKFRTLDEDTWDSQWRSKRPSVRGLVYPQYDENVHVLDSYEWNPNLPVYCGIDFGFTNANVAVYGQLSPDRKLIIFAEDWGTMRTALELGQSMKKAPWFKATIWRMGDPAAAGDRATLSKMGVEVVAADNTKDTAKDTSGISKVRWALRPLGGQQPFLYITRNCVNLRREMRTYHVPEEKDDVNTKEQPVKFDDHAVDALRYLVARLIKTPGEKR